MLNMTPMGRLGRKTSTQANMNHVVILGWRDTLPCEITLSKWFCLPSEKGSTLKGKNLLLWGLVCRKANRKSQTLFPLLKMMENLLSVFRAIKPFICIYVVQFLQVQKPTLKCLLSPRSLKVFLL